VLENTVSALSLKASLPPLMIHHPREHSHSRIKGIAHSQAVKRLQEYLEEDQGLRY